jgi:hypothetical protein
MDTANTQVRDESLWKQAKERADFKRHLITYVLVNIFLWLIWGFTSFRDYEFNRIPWPAYVTFFWGIGLAFNFFNAYFISKQNLEEKEYQKLVEKKRGL